MIDVYAKSSQLLEKLANSVAERNPTLKDFCFNVAEIHVVEEWIREFVKEVYGEIRSY